MLRPVVRPKSTRAFLVSLTNDTAYTLRTILFVPGIERIDACAAPQFLERNECYPFAATLMGALVQRQLG